MIPQKRIFRNLKLYEWVDNTKYFAWYIGDFRFPNTKIGALMFYWNEEKKGFGLSDDPDLSYKLHLVVEDSSWLIFHILDDDTIEPVDKQKFYEEHK